MRRVTYSFIMLVAVCVCIMVIALVFYNEARYRQSIVERNETCFQLGISLTDVMQNNATVFVESCNCYFGSVREGDLVTECICDCAIPAIPFTECVGFEGCYAHNYECRCRYGIVLNPESQG